ncbi:MAG TPA: ABC transporter substrate-binding protein [Candidatus Binatia bacterium]|nr:ABC transporter substrate-binding protein [Candidatus Binatia bacterium]
MTKATAIVLVLLLLSESIGLAQGTKIRVATSPNDSGAEAFYAQDMGFFKKAGLDVEVIAIGNASLIHSGVLSGSIDIGSTSMPPAALAHERGLPYVLIAPGAVYSSRTPTSALVVAKNSPIKTASDLNGKTIGVRDLTNVGSVATEAWIDKNGGDARSIKFVELPDSAAAPAVVQGRVDAASIAEPFLDEALKLDTRVLAPTYSAIANEFMIGAWFSTLDYAKAHPDIIRKFAAVVLETARWANKNQARSAQILAKYAKVTVSSTMARVGYAERLAPSQIQPLIDAAARYGTIKASFPASDLFAPGIRSQ